MSQLCSVILHVCYLCSEYLMFISIASQYKSCWLPLTHGVQNSVLPCILIYDFNLTVKQLTTKTDNRAWYEKLEDYEGDFEFVDEDGEEDEQGKESWDCEALYR
jgi:hypothetical protein